MLISSEESLQIQGLGQSRGGFSTKIHILCEGAGKPITVTVTPGQQHESTQVGSLLDAVAIGGKPGPKRTRFDAIAGDKAYDSQAIREDLCQRRTQPVIAHRKNRQGEYPQEAEGFDKELYRQRNVVERLIGRIKENRRIATRYEKHADSYEAMIVLAFIRIWLKNLLSYTA